MLLLFELGFAAMPWVFDAMLGLDVDLASPLATVAEFAVFALPALALAIGLRVVHGRGLISLIGPPARATRHLIIATLAVATVLAVQEPILLWMDREQGLILRDPAHWLIWLVPGLIVITIQSGTEELLYRGYLQQQLGALSPRPLVWMVLPSVYFGFGHLYNGATTGEGVLWAIWATMLGLACADLTARTGTLGAAVGLHVANNVFATVVIGEAGGPFSGLALLLYPPVDALPPEIGLVALATPYTLVDLVLSALAVLVMWLAARVALRV